MQLRYTNCRSYLHGLHTNRVYHENIDVKNLMMSGKEHVAAQLLGKKYCNSPSNSSLKEKFHPKGDVAQMVERSLSMREAPGSMPGFSIFFSFCCGLFFFPVGSDNSKKKRKCLPPRELFNPSNEDNKLAW